MHVTKEPLSTVGEETGTTLTQAPGDINTVTGAELGANISNYHLLCSLSKRHESVGRRTK